MSARARATTTASIVLAVAVAFTTASCETPFAGQPLLEPVAANDPLLIRGREAFLHHCHQCHPNGAAGLGPTITGRSLPDGLIRFQVRNGLGAMPAFDEGHISDEELDAIIAYINALQETKARLDAG